MKENYDKKSILEMAQGGILEVVDREVGAIVDNITDINTSAVAKRKLTVTVVFSPDANRKTIMVQCSAKSALAPVEPVATALYITGNNKTGEMIVAEMTPQVPGQLAMDNQEQAPPKILKFERQA